MLKCEGSWVRQEHKGTVRRRLCGSSHLDSPGRRLPQRKLWNFLAQLGQVGGGLALWPSGTSTQCHWGRPDPDAARVGYGVARIYSEGPQGHRP